MAWKFKAPKTCRFWWRLCYKYRSRGESLYLNNNMLSDKVLYSGIIKSSTVANSLSKVITLKTTITNSEVVKVEDDTC
jgi:hypothetical protein